MLLVLEKKLRTKLRSQPSIDQAVKLDGFADRAKPICVEIWARQGRPKPGQVGKVMKDFCKLLLVQKLLGKPCQKVFAVCDEAAHAFLKNSWYGRFADEFGIKIVVVDVCHDTRTRLLAAQKRQVR